MKIRSTILLSAALLLLAPARAPADHLFVDHGEVTDGSQAMFDARWNCRNGSALYVVEDSHPVALRVYDISSLPGSAPGVTWDTPVTTLQTNANSGGICRGDILYTFGGDGIEVYDVQSALNPTFVRATDPGSVASVIVDGGMLIAVGHLFGVAVYDLSDPLDPTLLDTLSLGPNISGFAVARYGSLVYVGQFDGVTLATAIRVVDISDPSDLADVNTVPTSDFTYHLRVVDGVLLAAMDQSVTLFDLTTPTSPSVLDTTTASARTLAVHGDVHLVNGSAYRIVDGGSGPEVVEVDQYSFGSTPSGLPHRGDTWDAFVLLQLSDRVRILERQGYFADGFESGDTSAWSASVP